MGMNLVPWIGPQYSCTSNSRAGCGARLARTKSLGQQEYHLNEVHRGIVLAAIQEVCRYRGWTLVAAHVRSTHVHTIVEAEVRPEKVLNDFKKYASRRLNEGSLDIQNRKRWSRHGSTRWLFHRDGVAAAIRYVVEQQGEAMAMYVAEE